MQKIQALFLSFVALLSACDSLPLKETPAALPGVAPTCSPCTACPPPMPAPSCTPSITPVTPPAFSRNYHAAQWADLPGWQEDDLSAVWPAFLESCRGMNSKPHAAAWKKVCDLARKDKGEISRNPRAFFESQLRPHAVSTGEGVTHGMITGYYEPLLRGKRIADKTFNQAVLGVPGDLLTIDLSSVFPELKDKRVRGRLVGNKVLPYWSRAEIAARAEQLPTQPLLYVDDAVELFFLQVQGSGRVKLPDGSMVRLNYADQNGHPYHSIGRALVERGELKLEEASMQGIQAWARANPKRLDELLNINPSYVFFREVNNNSAGPIGALGVPLTAERSIAIDPRAIPLGAPVFLATTRPNSNQPMNRMVMAQDTGGAIKGAVRADFFWGFGREAGEQAGRMKQSGKLWILWPAGAALK